MRGFKNQGSAQPTAMGSMLQSSCYGSTIPTGYGTTQSPLLAIWAANLRTGPSGKKGKNSGKKSTPTYVENIDFLLGHNPIMGMLQAMVNGSNYPLNFTSEEFSSAGGPQTLAVTDSNFYFVVAVTLVANYSLVTNDYGAQGTANLSGSYEVPLWNELETGPDPTGPASYRNWPYCYRWQPTFGNEVYIDSASFPAGTVKIYYAQLMDATSYQPPITKLQLSFEQQLGSGDEYAEAPAPYDSQQIIYPHFAGCGSPNVDLGSSGTIPQVLPEVRFKWGVYPSMDADFVDMIEDIFKSGLAQAALGASPAYTQMERGLSSYDLPGLVQLKVDAGAAAGAAAIGFNLTNTAGNFLVVVATGGSGLAISDTAGNAWTAVASGIAGAQVWYCNCVGGPNTVTITGLAANWEVAAMEIAGVDTFDAVQASSTASCSIASTMTPGMPAYLLAIPLYVGGGAAPASIANWDCVTPANFYGTSPGKYSVQERRITAPGAYPVSFAGAAPSGVVMLAFKSSQAATYPKPVGDFIDLPSLDLTRAQCRANGLYGSLTMTSQSAASDWLKSLCQAANCAPVYLGSKLYLLPYSEVSAAGNGAIYTAPTAAGPVANLDADNGDFVGDGGTPVLKTGSRNNLPNVLQMQCISRASNYNQCVVSYPISGATALYGQRKQDPVVNNAVQDPSIALMLLAIAGRRQQYGGDTWTFTASPRWSLLSPMDLITLTDRLQGISKVPVRITSWEEQSDGSFAGTAEPFIYGMCAPGSTPATTPAPNALVTNTPAGNVNAPVFIEPTADLSNNPTQDELWIAVSAPAPNYGGCQVFMSTDGGLSYEAAGDAIVGSAITGVSTADWPAAADPDSANNLALDLTESNGVLESYDTANEDNFLYPCYVGGGGSYSIPYELMCYAAATLTAPNNFTLMATGGNHLRRGVFGAPAAGVGVDHPAGSRFAFLPPSGQGILKITLPSSLIGVELFFKFVSFNSFGNAVQALAEVPAYSYTPVGVGSGTAAIPQSSVSGLTTTLAAKAAVASPAFSAEISTPHIVGAASGTSIAAGAAAGTAAAASLAAGSTDLSGIVQLTTGTVPAAPGTLATITFGAPYGADVTVVLTPANEAAAALSGAQQVFVPQGGTASFTVQAGSSALAASTAYAWNYIVIQ